MLLKRSCGVSNSRHARLGAAWQTLPQHTRSVPKAVGAPFVGAVAATLVISHLPRLLNESTVDALVDLDLRSEHRHVVPTQFDFAGFNPGYVQVAQTCEVP